MRARFDQDDEFRIRLRGLRPQAPHLIRLSGKTLGHLLVRRGAGAHVPTPAKGTAAAVVKVRYVASGRATGLAAYLQRDKTEASQGVSEYLQSHGGPEGKAELFTKPGQSVELDRFIAESRRDPRLWHVILAPEHGNRLDLQTYTQRYMEQVEQDLGHRLDYVAAVHTNTLHHHSHILVRGKDQNGEAFRIDKDYVRHGLRNRAMEIQQRWINLGLTHEPQQVHQPEQTQDRTHSPVQETIDRLQQWVGRHARDKDLDRGMSW